MKRSVSVIAASLVVAAVFAQESEEGEAKPEAAEVAKPAPVAAYTALPFCRTAEGGCEVRLPGSADWVAAEEGRFYPLGSAYRTKKDGRMTVSFGPECTVTVVDEAEFGTRVQKLGEAVRTIVLAAGTVEISLPKAQPAGSFFVAAPGFTVKNLTGESKFVYSDKGDGDDVVVRCKTGGMSVDGRHFSIPAMRAADEFRIRTSHDHLETILYGTSGDYLLKVDRGLVTKNEVADDGSVKQVVENSLLDWNLSPATKVRINRMVPSVGERLSVTVMAFDAAGDLKHNFAFAEGRAEVNTGELVVATKEESEDLAKRAAEATENTAADVGGEAADAAKENNENKKSEATEE